MSESVRVLRIGTNEYAATVHEGQDTTHHTVTISPAFLEDLMLPDTDTALVAEESIRYLLDRQPGVAIPAEVDLDRLSHEDDNIVAELRERLTT